MDKTWNKTWNKTNIGYEVTISMSFCAVWRYFFDFFADMFVSFDALEWKRDKTKVG